MNVQNVDRLQAGPVRSWHEAPAEEALNLLQSHPEAGLDEAEAADRLQQFGPNLDPERFTDRRGGAPVVAGQHHRPDTGVRQRAQAVLGVGPRFIPHGDRAGSCATDDEYRNRLALFIQGMDSVGLFIRKASTDRCRLR